jgi:putative copper resistance protein D
MEGIADFLDSLMGGIGLVFFSMSIGGLLWGCFVLKPWALNNNEILINKSITLIFIGSYSLILIQLIKLILTLWLMTATLERWPFADLIHTEQFQAGCLRIFFALILSIHLKYVLKNQQRSKKHWFQALTLTLPLICAGAWLVHGASRLENSAILMSLSILHQLSAAAWVGSIFQAILLWKLTKASQINNDLWPLLLKRFSLLGVIAVCGLIVTGLSISYNYFDSLNGIIGTGYGNLLLVKILMLMLAVGFAFANRQAVQHYFICHNSYSLTRRVPHYIEAETLVLVIILFTAASLASQPPAIDIPFLTSSWEQVLNTFAPRIPRILSPSHESLLAGEAGRIAIIGQIPSSAATQWSDYNHNIAGIFLTVMSVFAMLSYRKNAHWEKFWPLGFIGLGVFLFFRSDAESWPLGPIGFWESTFNNGEILQHRIATLLVLTLGIMELKARMTKNPNSQLPYVFPILSAFGGLMLLAHSHVGFEPKSTFLIQVGHTLMGFFSLILACGRWLELKLDYPGNKIAGFVSVFALFQIGMILMFYREPLSNQV